MRNLHTGGEDWVVMSVNADQARSYSWLKNMAERGAWGPAGSARVGPPTPEQFPGLAELLQTTPDAVAAILVADFYGVGAQHGYSAWVQRLAPTIDNLSSKDADMVETLIHRLGSS